MPLKSKRVSLTENDYSLGYTLPPSTHTRAHTTAPPRVRLITNVTHRQGRVDGDGGDVVLVKVCKLIVNQRNQR